MLEQYVYNESGLRIQKDEFLGNNKKSTYYMYSGNDILFTETYINDEPVEMQFNIADLASYTYYYGQDAKEELNYYYKDHRSNKVVKLDQNGNIANANKFNYSTWGELDNTCATEESWFTGKKMDETGLYYFNARYYDPIMGRFLQQDPSKQGINWYTYCNNNPINLTDPDGRREMVTCSMQEEAELDRVLAKVERNKDYTMPPDSGYEYYSHKEIKTLANYGYKINAKYYEELSAGWTSGTDVSKVDLGYVITNSRDAFPEIYKPQVSEPISGSGSGDTQTGDTLTGETVATVIASVGVSESGVFGEVLARYYTGRNWSVFAAAGGKISGGLEAWAKAGATYQVIETRNFGLSVTAEGQASTSSGTRATVKAEGTFENLAGSPVDVTLSVMAGTSGYGVGVTATLPIAGAAKIR